MGAVSLEEDWLVRNTFQCDKLAARMRREQCGINRQRARTAPYGPLWHCARCDGPEAVEEKAMGVRCNEDGCGKFAVKGGKCTAHWRESQGLPPDGRKAKKQAPAEAAPGGAKPGVLSLVSQPTTVPARPGFFLDFTGHEDVLQRLQAVSEDLNHDVICVLSAVVNEELCFRGE